MVMVLSGWVGMAQDAIRPVEDEKSFIASVQDRMAKVSSLQSEFKQRKHITGIKKDIVSSGSFYYEKAGKVCLSYEKPAKSKIVINGDKLMMEMAGVKNVCSVSSNAMMQEMVNVMSSCMTGDLQGLRTNYQLEFLQTDTNYVVKVIPKKASVGKMVERIELFLLKSDFSVESLKMVEASRGRAKREDYTEYSFSNKKENAAIPVSTFSLK